MFSFMFNILDCNTNLFSMRSQNVFWYLRLVNLDTILDFSFIHIGYLEVLLVNPICGI